MDRDPNTYPRKLVDVFKEAGMLVEPTWLCVCMAMSCGHEWKTIAVRPTGSCRECGGNFAFWKDKEHEYYEED